jgi:hypothetical protein
LNCHHIQNEQKSEPDGEGFIISVEEAEEFNKNMNTFNFIGKKILLPINQEKSMIEL